jgi:maltose O-acetyltransferase
MKQLVQLAAYGFYVTVAAQLPNRPRICKLLRVRALRLAGVQVHPTANINRKARISRRAVIAEHAGVGEGSSLSGEVHLGPHVTMGPQCYFITGDHPIPGDGEHFRDRSPVHSPIVVGEDVFFGGRVIVLPGVEIGAGAAVGAGAVVTRDVAPGSTVVGNPAREVRRRQVEP